MMQCFLQPHNAASYARGHGEADADAFALMRVANAHSVYATPRYQTWRKSSFGRLSVGEPRLSHTRCTNAPRAMCATSASDVAPSATIFAEPWDSEVFARTASSQSCSAIFWTWRCSSFHFAHPLRPRLIEAAWAAHHPSSRRLAVDFAATMQTASAAIPLPRMRQATTTFASISPREVVPPTEIHSAANGHGHAALLTQSLDNPYGVTHMTTPE
jgi:hypothetical protein